MTSEDHYRQVSLLYDFYLKVLLGVWVERANWSSEREGLIGYSTTLNDHGGREQSGL